MINTSLLTKSTAANPFRGIAGNILRELIKPQYKHSLITATDLANNLDISIAWCNQVLNTLESINVVERNKRGVGASTTLVNKKKLITEWKAYYNFSRNIFYPYVTKYENSMDILCNICDDNNWSYAVTHKSVKQLLQNKNLSNPAYIFVVPNKKGRNAYSDMLKKLEKKHAFYRVKENPDIYIIKPMLGTSVFFDNRTVNNINCVSDFQLMLDSKI